MCRIVADEILVRLVMLLQNNYWVRLHTYESSVGATRDQGICLASRVRSCTQHRAAWTNPNSCRISFYTCMLCSFQKMRCRGIWVWSVAGLTRGLMHCKLDEKTVCAHFSPEYWTDETTVIDCSVRKNWTHVYSCWRYAEVTMMIESLRLYLSMCGMSWPDILLRRLLRDARNGDWVIYCRQRDVDERCLQGSPTLLEKKNKDHVKGGLAQVRIQSF